MQSLYRLSCGSVRVLCLQSADCYIQLCIILCCYLDAPSHRALQTSQKASIHHHAHFVLSPLYPSLSASTCRKAADVCLENATPGPDLTLPWASADTPVHWVACWTHLLAPFCLTVACNSWALFSARSQMRSASSALGKGLCWLCSSCRIDPALAGCIAASGLRLLDNGRQSDGSHPQANTTACLDILWGAQCI